MSSFNLTHGSLRRPVSESSSGTAPPAFGYAPSTEEQRRPRGPASGPDAGMQQRPSSARDPSAVAPTGHSVADRGDEVSAAARSPAAERGTAGPLGSLTRVKTWGGSRFRPHHSVRAFTAPPREETRSHV